MGSHGGGRCQGCFWSKSGTEPSARLGVGLSHPCSGSRSQQHSGRSGWVSPLRVGIAAPGGHRRSGWVSPLRVGISPVGIAAPGGHRRSGSALLPNVCSRWDVRLQVSLGHRGSAGSRQVSCPFTAELGRLSPLRTGGDGLREGRARTRTYGRGCGLFPQPGVKCSGVPGSAMRGRRGDAGPERSGHAGAHPTAPMPSGCFPLAGTGGLAGGCSRPGPAPHRLPQPRAAALQHVGKAGRASGAAAAAERTRSSDL